MTIKNYLKQDSGSTSVLIVIMMIVLMAFGMAALTTSYAGFKLAQKNVEFNKEFYEIEGQASRIKFDMVQILSLVNQELQDNPNIFDVDTYYELFTQSANEKIIKYLNEHSDVLLEPAFEFDEFDPLMESGEDVRIGTLYYTVTSSDENPKHISVKLDIYVPTIEETLVLDQVIHTLSWYEWQDGIGEVTNDIFFEDPFEEPEGDTNGETNPFIVPEEDKDN